MPSDKAPKGVTGLKPCATYQGPETRDHGLRTAIRHAAALVATMGHRVTLALGLLLLCSLTEGLGLLLLVPMLQAVGLDAGQGALGRLAALVARGFSAAGMRPTLPGVLAVFVAVAVAQALLVSGGRVRAWDGSEVAVSAGTICIHSDTPEALAIARAVDGVLRHA